MQVDNKNRIKVLHTNPAPVMIIGHGSSGTSILTRLMRDYLDVAFGTESQFIIHYYNRLPMYGDLQQDANLRTLVEHILRERWFERCGKWGFATTVDAVLADVQARTYRGVLDAVFLQLAKHFGHPRWGDKTPEYTHHLATIGELFPDAQYIHMVRDGRDVALSVSNRYWGDKNVYCAAHEWKREVSQVDAFTDSLPRQQWIEITYEGMLSEPVETFRRIIEFLKIDDSSGALAERIERDLPGDLNRANFDKWKTAWSQRQQLAFERIACDVLARHGYETNLDAPDPHDSVLQRIYWQADNRVRKWMYAEYWKDNLYKAKLRTRNAVRRLQASVQRPAKSHSADQ